MKRNKFIGTFIICFLLYLLPEVFVNDALLYLSGGVIGGAISKFLNTNNNILVFIIWGIIILIIYFGYLRIKLKWLKYLILIIIAFTLNIIDNIFASATIFDIESKNITNLINYIIMFFEILLKSFILCLIYHKGNKD